MKNKIIFCCLLIIIILILIFLKFNKTTKESNESYAFSAGFVINDILENNKIFNSFWYPVKFFDKKKHLNGSVYFKTQNDKNKYLLNDDNKIINESNNLITDYSSIIYNLEIQNNLFCIEIKPLKDININTENLIKNNILIKNSNEISNYTLIELDTEKNKYEKIYLNSFYNGLDTIIHLTGIIKNKNENLYSIDLNFSITDEDYKLDNTKKLEILNILENMNEK